MLQEKIRQLKDIKAQLQKINTDEDDPMLKQIESQIQAYINQLDTKTK